MLREIFLIAVLCGAGCNPSGDVDLGQPCTRTSQCKPDQECVLVDTESACLPIDGTRRESSCNDACQLWPIESECLDGDCRCLGDEVLCAINEDDTFSRVLEEETCLCVDRGNEGDRCVTSHTCRPGMTCRGGECRTTTPGEAGSACGATEPVNPNLGFADTVDCAFNEGLDCVKRANNAVGVCERG